MFHILRASSQVITAFAVFASGCASSDLHQADDLFRSGAIERRCGPLVSTQEQVFQAGSLRQTVPMGLRAVDSSTLGFSRQAHETADIIGAQHLLVQLANLEKEPNGNVESQNVRRLQVQQQISNRILLAFLDVARTAAEADCEEERADQLADRLQESRDKRIRHQTLIAIVGDAMIGIVAGGLSLALEETASASTAILGGTVATGFGLAAFFDNTEFEFRHQRNILREVWEGPERATLIPNSVWRYLNRPLNDDPAQRSLRQSLIVRWRQDGRFGEVGSDTQERRILLFFGEGGLYQIEDLRARAAMLDLLEADVNLMSQDLERLMQEVLDQESPV